MPAVSLQHLTETPQHHGPLLASEIRLQADKPPLHRRPGVAVPQVAGKARNLRPVRQCPVGIGVWDRNGSE
jgi:hypothetical protein